MDCDRRDNYACDLDSVSWDRASVPDVLLLLVVGDEITVADYGEEENEVAIQQKGPRRNCGESGSRGYW